MPLSAVRDFSFLSGKKKAGIILAVSVLLLAVFSVMSARYVGQAALHDSALSTAEAAAAAVVQGARPAGGNSLTSVAAYAVYSESGEMQHSGRLIETDDNARFAMPKTAAGAPITLSGGGQDSHRIDLRSEPSGLFGSVPTHAAFWIPADRYAAPGGAAWVLIDQSGSAITLISALQKAAFILLLIAVAALAVVSWALSRGPGDEKPSARPTIAYSGRRDALTNLPDRIQFQDQLERAVQEAKQADSTLAIVTVDLDRFKSVNDLWGHAVGDKLIIEAVERLKPVVGGNGTLARINGDEFAILVREDANPRTLKYLGQRIVDELGATYLVDDDAISLTASVGIATFPVNADNADGLFRAADLALFKAKSEGKQTVRFFDTEMERQLKKRSELERDLRNALKDDEFVVFYQPQLNLKTGDLCGYEALIRWERPGEGIISPMEFIPVAEETGLIKQLGEWVLRRACQDAAEWIDTGTVAVNFSASQFNYAGVDEMIAEVIRDTGIDPQRLEIEITESLFLNHSPDVMATLKRIKELGVRIAMDDFGTGYSSLNYLTQFPFDKIKIDRSFVSQLSNDPQIAAIISSIVGLGRSLSVDITAEGVETDDQVTLLQAAGCSIVQGFLFGAPTRAGHETEQERESA